MIQESERHYYRQRADMERACAYAATSDQVRMVHTELAKMFEERATAADAIIAPGRLAA